MKEVRITEAGLYEFTGNTRVVADADFVLSDSDIKVIDGSLEINCAVGSSCKFGLERTKSTTQQFNNVTVVKDGEKACIGVIHITVRQDGTSEYINISETLSNRAGAPVAPRSIVFREVVGDCNNVTTDGAAVVLEKSAGNFNGITTNGGSVVLKEPAGNSLLVVSSGGDISLSDIGANSSVNSKGAKIEAGYVGHKAVLDAGKGPITVTGKDAGAFLLSSGGKIRVLAEEVPPQPYVEKIFFIDKVLPNEEIKRVETVLVLGDVMEGGKACSVAGRVIVLGTARKRAVVEGEDDVIVLNGIDALAEITSNEGDVYAGAATPAANARIKAAGRVHHGDIPADKIPQRPAMPEIKMDEFPFADGDGNETNFVTEVPAGRDRVVKMGTIIFEGDVPAGKTIQSHDGAVYIQGRLEPGAKVMAKGIVAVRDGAEYGAYIKSDEADIYLGGDRAAGVKLITPKGHMFYEPFPSELIPQAAASNVSVKKASPKVGL
ncbi:MAG: hypothetical protein ACOYK8_00305 [Alphaproteobacteria bacterium]